MMGVNDLAYEFLKTNSTDTLAYITLNRPPVNIINIAMMEELICAFKWAEEAPGSLIVLNAEHKAFCAGVELAEYAGSQAEEMLDTFNRLFITMSAVEKPLVAAVNGVALGGGLEIVLFCDLVIASEKARFGQPEVTIGVFPPVSCYLLPRLLSWPLAMEMLLSGDLFDAARGEKLGLVNKILPEEDFAAGVDEYLKKFLNKSPAVLALAKKAASAGLNRDLTKGLAAIKTIFLNELLQTEDALEGLKALQEKRPPRWRKTAR